MSLSARRKPPLRVVTVTANAALDRTWFVDGLLPGGRNRVAEEHERAGGKGVNVARILSAMGVDVTAIVLVGGQAGQRIRADLERSDIASIVVETRGESRTCLEVIDRASGAATQLHQVGVRADPEAARRLRSAIERALVDTSWLALCGSLAEGLPDACYADWIALARERGARVALDASGAALRRGLEARPTLVRINSDEAIQALGTAEPGSSTWSRIRQHTRWGAVSAGGSKAWAWSGDALFDVVPPDVQPRNPIGCGDAMLAGLLATIGSSDDADVFRFAFAVASADAESPVAGSPNLARARELIPLTKISRSS